MTEIFHTLRSQANPEQAVQMKAYLRNQFDFIGLKTPERKALTADFLKAEVQLKTIDLNFVLQCFQQPEREIHHLGLEYLVRKRKLLQSADMDFLVTLVKTKSWWDTVDLISTNLIGFLIFHNPSLHKNKAEGWIYQDNMWLKRTAIICQLKFKEATNLTFLEKAILANAGTTEFFLNKAIGWALREYAKYDADYVKDFLFRNTLNSLSIREASKYLS